MRTHTFFGNSSKNIQDFYLLNIEKNFNVNYFGCNCVSRNSDTPHIDSIGKWLNNGREKVYRTYEEIKKHHHLIRV
jgi:hypothetical protein